MTERREATQAQELKNVKLQLQIEHAQLQGKFCLLNPYIWLHVELKARFEENERQHALEIEETIRRTSQGLVPSTVSRYFIYIKCSCYLAILLFTNILSYQLQMKMMSRLIFPFLQNLQIS